MSRSPRSLRYGSEADMPEGMRKLLRRQGSNPPAPSPRPAPPANPPPASAPGWVPGAPKRGSKYGAKPTEADGIRFDSKAEARYYLELKGRVEAGGVEFFFRQTPVHLPGNTRYVMDFLEFLPCTCGGCTCQRHRFVDVKGVETQTFRLKKRQVEDLYPIKIEVVK